MLRFNKRLEDIPVPSFYLQGKALTFSKEVRYLGYIISDDLSDDQDIADRVRWVYTIANSLCRMFNLCCAHVKYRLFCTYFNQIFGIALWTRTNNKMVQKIKVAYNDAYRMMFNMRRGENISSHMVFHRVMTFQEARRVSVHRSLQKCVVCIVAE